MNAMYHMFAYEAQVYLVSRIAKEAHLLQYRKETKKPYFTHCENVANRCRKISKLHEAVAYGHDLLEETELTASDLISFGVNDVIVRAIVALTKIKGESYERYLERVKENSIARSVKIEDMLDNLSDCPTNKQVEKYAKGLAFLRDE